MSSENRIHLLGDYYLRDEALSSAAISPGHLVEMDSSGYYKPHATEGGYAERCFAEANVLNGETVDTDYSSGDRVTVNYEVPGNKTQAMLAAGANVSIGTKLISAGDGTLIADGSEASGTTVRQIVAIATEAKDLSGSGAVDTLIEVRVL